MPPAIKQKEEGEESVMEKNTYGWTYYVLNPTEEKQGLCRPQVPHPEGSSSVLD